MFKSFISVVIIGAGGAAAVFLFLIISIFLPYNKAGAGQLEFVIQPREGAVQIAEALKEQNLIRSKNFFLFYIKITGNEKSLKAGEYSISTPISLAKLTDILSKGLTENNDILVTIPEGSNAWEVSKRFFEAGIFEGKELNNFISLAKKEEGYLFPDTYRFKKETKAEEAIRRMKENFENKTRDFKNLREEDIVMASILEKEVRTEEDMKIVSGVLWKRLRVGMLLQVDATVSYGVCLNSLENFCDISKVPLRNYLHMDGPYNTYTRRGFPAGPISNPGLKAITAALNPIESDYWFYLSATAEDGRTIFSKTLEEHNINRGKYLK